ncbi:hypothetical protein EGP99_03615 [bacterium]|nr:hypothetical protein [bacterium]
MYSVLFKRRVFKYMKEYVQTNRKKILIFIGVLIGVVILLMPTDTKNLEVEYNTNPKVALDSKKEITMEEKIELSLNEKGDTIKFLANTFLIDEEILRNKLENNYEELNYLDNMDSFDKIVLDYLLTLEESEKELFNNKRISNQMDKDYIVKTLKYFSDMYANVDFGIAAGIANVESGYTSKYMLSKNNIFGGMYNGGLISYKTIEYGVLKYVILLSEGYFGKGLVTIEDIGRVYNPTFESGIKIAKPAWVYNVTKSMELFADIQEVDTTDLINLKNDIDILAK